MKALCDLLWKLPELGELEKRVQNKRLPALLCGLSPIHKAHVIAALRRKTNRPVVVLTADENSASRIMTDTSSLAGEEAFVLGGRDFVFYNVDGASREFEHRRLHALRALSGRAGLVFVTAEGLAMRTLPPAVLERAALELVLSGRYDLEALAADLLARGYKRASAIDASSGGQFAVRGGIIDIFPVGAPLPVRIELFGDEVDSMGTFDPDSQRRVEPLGSVTILPASEVLPDLGEGGREGALARLREAVKAASSNKKAPPALAQNLAGDVERLENEGLFAAVDRVLPCIYPSFASALDYIPADALVVLDEPARFRERLAGYAWQIGEDTSALLENGSVAPYDGAGYVLSPEEVLSRASALDLVMLDAFAGARYEPAPRSILSLLAKQLPSYAGSLSSAADDISAYLSSGYAVLFLCPTLQRARHAAETLGAAGLEATVDPSPSPTPVSGRLVVGEGSLGSGFEYPALKLTVLTEGQLSAGLSKKKASKPKEKDARTRVKSFADLNVGDLVVHDTYGIGRFTGIEKMTLDGTTKDFIKIAYHGSDILYVPATQLDLIAKYIGAAEDSTVKLNRLGGGDWTKTRSRAKAAAKDLARQLIALYAARQRLEGFAFPPDSEWQKEFEDGFEYDETPDQLRSAAEIKADMEKRAPMDRLLCGDVGFGKTEVAFRAVMKCVLGGKQAALLVPTTVLARQHYQTAVHRFRGYPLRIGVLSRFTPPAKSREYLRQLSAGSLDLIIGTHKLLGKEVKFHDLGLVVVDEEQRFGVGHKEKLKELSKNVDVLTLTATPIPRTLNMALSGIRDMSVLEEAPRDRHPVQTYVLEHDWSLLADAMRREVARGGQVYYLHNRVETITRAAARIRSLLPDATVAVAHGQMNEEELSEVMRAVGDNEAQILVCTTIIETGIDIPNVNTLIIDEADKLGLAQLHQIRGRVGRSSRHAFAYLTYRPGRILTEVAQKRLSAIREFAEFGAGFKIAMRDLEIRGAGNVLGSEQSGHMMSVGYDMYLRLLEEAVIEEKGEPAAKRVETLADLAVSAHIPEEYIPVAAERMDIYRRIAYIRDDADAEDMTDELLDRYGEFPETVHNLIKIALLRSAASRAGVSEVQGKNGQILLKLARPDFGKISALCASPDFKGRVLVNAGGDPYLTFKLRGGEELLSSAERLVGALLKAEA